MPRARTALAAAIAVLAVAAPSAGAPRPPTLTFSVFVHTSQNMDSIVWTGSRFLYVQNTENAVFWAPPKGLPLHTFTKMPKLVEETRCILSPGTHGWPANVVFCHSPDDKIYEIPGGGGDAKMFASLPVPSGTVSDGALVWDDAGTFGYALVAATGRSGANQPKNGTVYTIDPSGTVKRVGAYQGAGVDEVAIAPPSFGALAGDALLGEDAGAAPSALRAMDASGNVKTVVRLSTGINPMIPIVTASARKGLPRAGLYLTDDLSGNTYFAPAAQLAAYNGDLLVASEVGERVWIVVPHGSSFRAIPVRHNPMHAKSIEAGIVIP